MTLAGFVTDAAEPALPGRGIPFWGITLADTGRMVADDPVELPAARSDGKEDWLLVKRSAIGVEVENSLARSSTVPAG